MDMTRFEQLLAAYGANPARWPDDERDAAEQLLAQSAPARAAQESAARLDAALAQASALSVTAALRERILAHAPLPAVPSPTPSPRELWPGGAAWQPAAALAASMILGLAVGAALESAFIPAMSDDDALASDVMGAFWLGDDEDWEG